MRYVDFKDVIQAELRKNIDGLTWAQLRERLNLPYDRPCQTWVYKLEAEIGLVRERGVGRALVWKLRTKSKGG